jgi:phosphate starvation-inducible PhoH-like protein
MGRKRNGNGHCNGQYKPKFGIKFLTQTQKEAWESFQDSSIIFLLGPAGVGKSYMATALAINEIENENRDKVILTRPIIESEESLGYLPGDIKEKTDPYMMPLFDQLQKLALANNKHRSEYDKILEVAPIAYMRGRTFSKAVCVLDEAQNCNYKQLKLFLTRFDIDTKVIITGDPSQKDIPDSGLMQVVDRLQDVEGISVIEFSKRDIVRHPLVEEIVKRL